nr:hypothetical protein [uncultured Bacillus sp.]
MKAMTLNGVRGRTELKHEISQSDCFLLRNRLKLAMETDPNDPRPLIRDLYVQSLSIGNSL